MQTLYLHWIRTALLFLLRSGRSTFALALMIMLAVAGLIFLAAFAVGVNDAMIRNSVGLFSGHMFADALPKSIPLKALQVEGVAHVLKRIAIMGTLSGGKGVEPVTMIGIAGPAERHATALHRKITRGTALGSDVDQILLSEKMAQRLGIRLGDQVAFAPHGVGKNLVLTVSGIYATGLAEMDSGLAICSIQRLAPFSATWHAAVFLSDGIEPEEIIAAYDKRFSIGDAFKTWKTTLPDLLQLIQLNYVRGRGVFRENA